MLCLKRSFLAVGLLLLFSSTLQAANSEYQCTVADMATFGDDQEFIEKNLRKKFLILLDEGRVYVTMLSEDFESSQDVYEIVNRSMSDIYAIKPTAATMKTLAMSEFYYESVYNATLVVQSNLSATVWKLNCQ